MGEPNAREMELATKSFDDGVGPDHLRFCQENFIAAHVREDAIQTTADLLAAYREELQDRDCIEVAMSVLRAHGSPLVCPLSDGGVLLCKDGVWASGKTLAGALEALQEALKKRRERA